MSAKLSAPQQRILLEVAQGPPNGTVYGARDGRTLYALARRGLIDGGYTTPAIVRLTDAGRSYVGQ